MSNDCRWCGESFDTEHGRSIHEGQKHKEAVKRERTVVCHTCGEEFVQDKEKLSRNERHFCSKECQYEGWEGNENPAPTGEEHPGWKGGRDTAVCDKCGKEFEKTPGNPNKFCSSECFYEWRSDNHRGEEHHHYNRVKVECSNCGEVIPRIESRVNENERHHFCNQSCANEFWHDGVDGMREYGYRWESAREVAMERDRYRCLNCDESQNLHVHHVIPVSEFDNILKAHILPNLLTLCSSCHTRLEKITEHPKRLDDFPEYPTKSGS